MSIYKGDKIIAGVSGGGGDIPVDIADQLAKKENKSNKVTVIDSTATDDQYPSAKAVNDSLALKENKSNKVTAIDDTATDDQYPSAKAVKNAISNVGIPAPIWAKAVYITNDMMLPPHYEVPADGWFICSRVAPAEGVYGSKEITINDYSIAYGERTSGYVSYGSSSCPVKKGDVIKTSASYYASQKCIFLPYK